MNKSLEREKQELQESLKKEKEKNDEISDKLKKCEHELKSSKTILNQ